MATEPTPRHPTHAVDIAGVKVGGGHPIVVQSMTNTDTADPLEIWRERSNAIARNT